MRSLSPTLLTLPLAAALVALGGCSAESDYEGAFIVPFAGDITPPGAETPFGETIAYVASLDGGQIRPLAAESGRFLTDDPAATFLRGSPLATGGRRVLTDVSLWSPDATRLTVFAADQAFGHLLEVPHVTGVDEDGFPIEPTVSTTGGEALTALEAHDGFATAEVWTLTWDGEVWRARGSRSGALDGSITPGIPYTPATEAFTLTAPAGSEVGETITFETLTGMVEHELGALPVALDMKDDQSVLAVAIVDDAGDGAVVLWDPESGTESERFELPGRSILTVRWDGDTLWVTDDQVETDDGEVVSGTLWRLPPGADALEPIAIPGAASFLEPVADQDRLYFSLAGGTSLYALDTAEDTLVDLDPVRPDSMAFPMHSVVQGLASLPGTVTQVDDTDDGESRTARVLAVSRYQGDVVFYDLDLGCLLQDGLGPRTTPVGRGQPGSSDTDYEWDFDGQVGGPTLLDNLSNDRHVVVNACAGIARDERWFLTFDEAALAWEVRGELSGVQSEMAIEGERYVSDSGAISFLIESGYIPTRDGWTFEFTTTDGVLGGAGDQDGDNVIDGNINEFQWVQPGQPLPMLLPPRGSRTEETPAVIVPLEGSNAVVRARPDSGLTDATWQ